MWDSTSILLYILYKVWFCNGNKDWCYLWAELRENKALVFHRRSKNTFKSTEFTINHLFFDRSLQVRLLHEVTAEYLPDVLVNQSQIAW